MIARMADQTVPGMPKRQRAPVGMRCLARTPYYAMRRAGARLLADLPLVPRAGDGAPVFIIGCGRSGTTLLGEILAAHPQVSYRHEPYHLWAAIDPVTDFVQRYSRGAHNCLLDARSVTPAARRRFQRLMTAPSGFMLVEKSPVNALRIGYLDALATGARYLHIVRDGVDVAHSISRKAAITHRMVFRAPMNEWWGVGEAKWQALERDGRAGGYYPDEVGQLTTDMQRGAYEWLLSLREVEAWGPRLGSRLMEIRYPDLTAEPQVVLKAVTDWLGLVCPEQWVRKTAARINPGSRVQRDQLVLPRQMAADFNALQEYFGFASRTECPESGTAHTPDQSAPAVLSNPKGLA